MAAPPPKKGRLSLYEDLISDNARAEIKARDDQAAADAAKKKKDASLMFRPTNLGKKPGNTAKAKTKPRPNFSAIHKISSSTSPVAGEGSAGVASSDAAPAPAKSQKRGFEDWLANDDDEPGPYDRPRQDRNAKKFKRNSYKKNKNAQHQQTWSYDDIYDPNVAVNITQYAKSEAAFQSKEMWKMRLFAANKKERQRLGQTAKARPAAKDFAQTPPVNSMFAPPPELSSFDDARPQSSGSSSHLDCLDLPPTSFAKPSFAPPASLAPPVANLNREETADEAYARRLALSSRSAQPVAPAPPVSTTQNILPAKVVTPEELEKRAKAAQQIAALKAKMAAKSAASAPTQAPAPTSSSSVPSPPPAPEPAPAPAPAPASLPSNTQVFLPATGPAQTYTQEDLDTLQAVLKQPDVPDRQYSPEVIIEKTVSGVALSRGPIRAGSVIAPGFPPTISGAPTYNYGFPGIAPQMDSRIATQTLATTSPPPQQEGAPAVDETEEPSKRPGQDGFAERLLKKMGWEKGQGLGASNDGITTAIVMKADKSKRVPGRTTGGRAPTIGKIVGGNKKKTTDSEDDTPHGNMSEVIKLEGMLKGLDVDLEIAENNLMQEIGDHMGEMYGKVERLFIWRGHMGGNEEVFVRFTSQLSALRAVKGLDGEEFAGNLVDGKFWDAGKFERGEYL